MSKHGRSSIEETIIEAPLSEQELEKLLVGFLEALEKENRLGLNDDEKETTLEKKGVPA